MRILKDIWSIVSSAGVTIDMDSRLARKVTLTNQITFLACTTTFAQMFMFPTISMFPLLCAGAIAAYSMTFWFNSKQWHNLSRLYFCIISCVVLVVTGGLISEEINISFRLILIQAFVLPIVVFDIQESKLQLIGALSFILSYILFDPINASIPLMEGVDTSVFDSQTNIVVNGVLCMVTLLLGNRYLQKLNFKAENNLNHALDISDQQRLEILKKNEFIQEGIAYAERIQQAVLPNKEEMNIYLPDHFVHFEPRETIGGDFYWYGEFQEHILIAAVDCTGHGAPGALISIIGSQLLDKIVKDQGVTDPAEVLEILNLEIIKTLHQDNTVLKDGMDISLLSIDTQEKKIRFAGAKNSLIILRDGEVQRLRGKGVSIGDSYQIADGFTNHEIEVSSQDCLFLITDGIIDQFGAKSDKKLLHKGLYRLLSASHEYSMDLQADCLKRDLSNWRGETPQTDDILMIGLRVNFEHISHVRAFLKPDSESAHLGSIAS